MGEKREAGKLSQPVLGLPFNTSELTPGHREGADTEFAALWPPQPYAKLNQVNLLLSSSPLCPFLFPFSHLRRCQCP